MYRTIDTATWDDPWFAELEPLDKLLFLYLVSNHRSTACGAYEITLRAIAFETGLTTEQTRKGLARLAPKILWWGDYQVVWIRNFYKHQCANSNPANFKVAARRKLTDFPPEVQEAICKVYPELTPEDGIPTLLDSEDTHTHAIPIPYPTDGDKETVTDTVTVTEDTARARARAVDFSSFFSELWKHYPTREGVPKIGKTETEALVRLIPGEDWPKVLQAVKNYAASGRLPVDPMRFFKSRDYPKGMWRQFVVMEASNSNGTHRQNTVEIGETKPRNRVPGLREALEERKSQAKGA